MTICEIKEFVKDDLARVRELIDLSLRSGIELLDDTNRALLSRPSKGLRPLLSILTAYACAGEMAEDSYRFAAAVELLHNATLLHDDVADESPTRRGKPTVNTILGSSASVLLGDFWLVRAMDRILDSPQGTLMIRFFAKTLSDLAEGEMLQLQKAACGDTSEEDYMKIIYYKTASLFELSAVSGAKSVNASEEMVSAARTYARNLGLAFQIKDDIFDYSAGAEIGKPVGSDLLEQKITLPLIASMAASTPSQEAEIRSMVADIPSNPSRVDEIREFVFSHKGIEYSVKRMEELLEEAKAALAAFPEGEGRMRLEAVADYVSERKI